jgi:hypothetical protein
MARLAVPIPSCSTPFRSFSIYRTASAPFPAAKPSRPSQLPLKPSWISNELLPWFSTPPRFPSTPSFPMLLSQVVTISAEQVNQWGRHEWRRGSGMIAGGFILTCKHVAKPDVKTGWKNTGRVRFTMAAELDTWDNTLEAREAPALSSTAATPSFFECSLEPQLNERLQSLRLYDLVFQEDLNNTNLSPRERDEALNSVDDVYLLRVSQEGLAYATRLLGHAPPPLRIAQSVQPDDSLFALGYPVAPRNLLLCRLNSICFHLFAPSKTRRSCSHGHLTAALQPTADLSIPHVRSSAAVRLGMSGGPLMNDRGELVGVNIAVKKYPFSEFSIAYPLTNNEKIQQSMQNCGMLVLERSDSQAKPVKTGSRTSKR